MKQLSIGIIGCGAITEQFHLPILHNLSGFTVAWLCDRDAARAKRVAGRFRVGRYYESPSQCPDVDAVLVATPVGTRSAILKQTSERGWHAFCEKPFAIDVPDHETMLEDGAKRSLVMTCGFMRRFYWATTTGADLLWTLFNDGSVRVLASDCDRIKRTVQGGSTYLSNPAASGGGFLMETGSHLIDQTLALFDTVDIDIDRVSQKVFDGIEYETIARGFLTDKQKRATPLEFAVSKLRDMWCGIVISSETLKLEVPLYPGSPIVLTNSANGTRCILACPHDMAQGVIEAYAIQFVRFADRIEQGETSSNPSATGLLTTRFLSRCYGRQHTTSVIA